MNILEKTPNTELLALKLLELGNLTLDRMENEVKGKIDDLEGQNSVMRVAADLTEELARMQKKGESLDINGNEELKRLFLCCHRLHPHLFGDFVENFPEGIASQTLEISGLSAEGIVDAALEGVVVADVTVKSLSSESIEILLQGLEAESEVGASEVNQVTFVINQIYGNREQTVSILREMFEQFRKAISHMNSNSRV